MTSTLPFAFITVMNEQDELGSTVWAFEDIDTAHDAERLLVANSVSYTRKLTSDDPASAPALLAAAGGLNDCDELLDALVASGDVQAAA